MLDSYDLKVQFFKKMYCSPIFLFLIFGFATAGKDVVNLDDSNYADFIRKNENVFVMYYRKLNDYCIKVRIRFEDAAYNSKEVPFAQIDCSREGKKTCKRAGKRGRPDFIFFRNGVPIGEQREDFYTKSFLDFVDDMMTDNIAKFKSVEDLEKHFDKYPETVFSVGFYHEDSPMKPIFTKMADRLRQYMSFASVILEKAEEDKIDKVLLYLPKAYRTPDESHSYAYPNVEDEKELYDWYMRNMHLTVRIRTAKNAWKFENSDKPGVIVYYRYNFSDPSSVQLRQQIHVVSQSFYMHFYFYLCSPVDFPHELLQYGIEEVSNVRTAIVTVKYKHKKYMMTAPFSVKNMEDFLNDLLKGAVKPFIVSEPVQSQSGLIKKVVGDNIEKEIELEKRDILLLFHLPWCPKSQDIGKKLEMLAEKLKDEAVVIMKMDAASNDIPYPFLSHIESYPIIFWIPNSKIYPMVVYKGPEKVQAMLKFVTSNATQELKFYLRSGRLREEL